jgi:hypothetical protein
MMPAVTTDTTSPETRRLGRFVRLACGALSGILLASALTGFFAAWRIPPKPGWAMMGFEAVITVSGVYGILLSRGRFSATPALTLACIAGATFVGSVLGYVGVQKKLAEHSLSPFLLGRIGIAAAFVAMSVGVAIGPSREGWKLLIRGVLALVPLIGIVAWYHYARLAPLLAGGEGAVEILRLAGLTIVAVAAGACICAAIHWTIRSFEVAGSHRTQA